MKGVEMGISMPLVSGAELALHLRDQEVLVCDCRFAGDAAGSRESYESGHIPGAVHVYWLDDLSAADTTVTTFLPNEDEATTALGRLGVTDETVVVAYADCGNLYASRLWHVLTLYGHDRVALLDGGIEKWESEGRPIERGSVESTPATFRSRESVWQRRIAAQEILERLEDPSFKLVDVRGPAEFSGEDRRAARGGHIPGAVLWPWEGNLRPDGTVRGADEIRARAQAAGLMPDHELVAYCQGGVRAAHAALALRAAGYQRVRIYDGSWAEWGNDAELPIVANPAAAAAG
jgi:thiosulfate/3-mercaptopyruvate sulfurtransferase